jgi:hypothetical protein
MFLHLYPKNVKRADPKNPTIDYLPCVSESPRVCLRIDGPDGSYLLEFLRNQREFKVNL